MKILIEKYLGDTAFTFEVEGNDLKDSLEKASRFSDSSRKGNLPDRCGICGDKNLVLTSYRTKEKNYLYVKIYCQSEKCKAYSELGLNTKTGEYYWKPFEQYLPGVISTPKAVADVNPDDVPF